jgi:hypothetical protein
MLAGESSWKSPSKTSFRCGSADTPGSRFNSPVAIEGSLISFEEEQPNVSVRPILGELYVELRGVGVPLVAQVERDTATWETALADGRGVRFRLSSHRA